MRRRWWRTGPVLALAGLLLAQAPAPPAADIVAPRREVFALPGDGPWDYVSFDPAAGRVFIGRYNGVQVVRADTGKLETMIGARTGDHGATVAANVGRLFTSDARARRLGVYDLRTLAAQPALPLSGPPDGLVYDPVSRRLLVFLPHSHEIVAVDAAAPHVAGRLDVGGEAEGGAADGHGAVFVTLRDRGQVLRIDAASLRITAQWPAGCPRPSPVAMDEADGRLFIGCRDQRILVMDAGSGRILARLPGGEGTDAMVFDPGRRLAAAANAGGSITLVRSDRPDAWRVAAQIPMPLGARTMALDVARGRLFTVTADVARVEPPTPARPFARVIPKAGTFRLIVLHLAP